MTGKKGQENYFSIDTDPTNLIQLILLILIISLLSGSNPESILWTMLSNLYPSSWITHFACAIYTFPQGSQDWDFSRMNHEIWFSHMNGN